MLKHLSYQKIILFLLTLSYLVYFITYQNERVNLDVPIAPFEDNQNVAVFAGYSQDGTISSYVVDYLEKLKEVAPNIVYVTDNPIKRSEIRKIRPFINYLAAYRHGEYDWGSYKRGLNAIAQNKSFRKLILANDSTLAVARSFGSILDKMEQDKADFYGITANVDGQYHLQSYFLVFNQDVWQTKEFKAYFFNVTKEKDGLRVAYRYEVPFTKYLEDLGYKSGTYIPYESLKNLPLNDKNCYPLTLLTKYHMPFLKMRTFTNRLNVQESRRLVFKWLKNNRPTAYKNLLSHLKKINSPYLKENKE